MSILYELAVLGAPTATQVSELEAHISLAVKKFGLQLGRDIAWRVRPDAFNPKQKNATAAVYFCGPSAPTANLDELLHKSIPVLPVVSDLSAVGTDLPPILRHLNCLEYNSGGSLRVATALLECAGLLPRQRRVFLSYRRDEARQAALQLFDALSARIFDVFLDTHDIAPADDFQTMLWHRLCDSDVLIMLDTPTYFNSRWTSAEFGRAQAKGISIMQIVWPGTTPSVRTATCSRMVLTAGEVDPDYGVLSNDVVTNICMQIEVVRSQSHAVRNLNLVSNLRQSIKKVGGTIVGLGLNKSIFVKLADDRTIVVYPTLGVPTSLNIHEASINAPGRSVAVLYDHVGLHTTWQNHLEWLGNHIKTARYVKSVEAAWQFADWEA